MMVGEISRIEIGKIDQREGNQNQKVQFKVVKENVTENDMWPKFQ